MTEKPTRQELYARIRQSSKDAVQLDEMLRLGFWNSADAASTVPEELIRREAQLREELSKLTRQQRRFENRDQALADMRRQRMKDSRERRRETKERRQRERIERAAAWKAKQQQHIGYLGEGVSGQLQTVLGENERLTAAGLPVFDDHAALASAMGIEMAELRFLAFHREVSTVCHYRRFRIPKKLGGFREISAPMPRLKAVQRWVLDNILALVPLRDEAHGFRPAHSIVSNAEPHVGKDIVINLDLRDFFPSVTLWRVWGVFQSLGYSPSVATILALICTECPVDEVELDGKRWFVANGERCLPQGGPTSPAITNVLCRRMDARLNGIAKKHGFTYTRYADDLTFSASGSAADNVTRLLWHTKLVIDEEGFEVHDEKERIMRSGRRQEVTGLVVNDVLSVPRKDVRAFRALLHRVESSGLANAHWRGESENLLDRIHGFSSFLHMVDAERYAGIRSRAKAVLKQHGYSPQPMKPRPAEGAGEGSESGPEAQEEATGFWTKIKNFFTGK